jgi:polyvinyl alcohol dehydrogenase (cytochrome)
MPKSPLLLLLVVCSFAALGQDAADPGAADPGAAVYKLHCASCHDSGAVRVPTRSVLQERTSAAILKSLTTGVMMQQAAMLSPGERRVVVAWLGRKTALGIDTKALSGLCTSKEALSSHPRQPEWISWGGGLDNLRFQPAQAAGVTAGDAEHLKLKWAFAVPDATSMRSQPAVYGGRIIFAGGGMVYALDAATGCTYWATEMPAAVRSAIAIGSPAGAPLAFFGDQAGNAHAIDVATGKPVWQQHVDANPTSMVTGTPVYFKQRLYVPVASYEEVITMRPGYLCCTFRGSIVALEARSGKILWKSYTVDDAARAEHTTKQGGKTVGPSGASVWSAPTIDADKNLLYAATGDNFSDPPTDKSDAVVALSLETGKIVWSKQFRAGDAFNGACGVPGSKNCPDANGPDFDLGASPILEKLPGGHRALILAQKSGAVYAVDPDEQGKLLWQAQLGKGGVLGGIEWGPAADAERVYVAISDEAFLPSNGGDNLDPEKGGGMFALRLESGERLWATPPPPCDAHRPCSPAQPGAVTAIPGAVFAGSLDGHLRAYSATSGKILWDYDTVHEYKTVNGVAGRGGSLNVAGPVVVNGAVYAVSGYDQFGGAPGNMLLAFTVDGH